MTVSISCSDVACCAAGLQIRTVSSAPAEARTGSCGCAVTQLTPTSSPNKILTMAPAHPRLGSASPKKGIAWSKLVRALHISITPKAEAHPTSPHLYQNPRRRHARRLIQKQQTPSAHPAGSRLSSCSGCGAPYNSTCSSAHRRPPPHSSHPIIESIQSGSSYDASTHLGRQGIIRGPGERVKLRQNKSKLMGIPQGIEALDILLLWHPAWSVVRETNRSLLVHLPLSAPLELRLQLQALIAVRQT
jgi:hypothetical protein